MPRSLTSPRLGEHLESLYRRYGAAFVDTDPVSFPRRYSRRDDREVVGFVAAALAYGRVEQIRRSVGKVAAVLGERPARAVRRFDPVSGREKLSGFVHRWNDAEDVGLLLWMVRQMLERDGSIEGFFLRGYEPGHDDIGPALSSFAARALELDCAPYHPDGNLPASAGVRFFFPSPSGGSTCKRLAMFLRWMVRPDDGVDFGLWRGVRPSKLVIPLDTHVSRIASYLGLTSRRSVGWRMAQEVTAHLRIFAPEDPVRFDFALCRLGILNACPRRHDPRKCRGCDLRTVCTLS